LFNFYSPSRLIESKDKEGKDWEVVLIQAGPSLNKKFYPPEVLKRAVNLFENAKAFAYEFQGKIWNHLPGSVRKVIPGGCLKNIVGWYSEPKYTTFKDDNGMTKEGILAKFHIPESALWLRKFLKEAWENGVKSLLGFSIDGDGTLSEDEIDGKKVWRVEDIKSINEVTLVTNPAAGGKFCRLLASKDFIKEDNKMEWIKQLFEKVKSLNAVIVEGLDLNNITADQEISLIKYLIESDEVKIEEAGGPFMAATLDRLIELLKGDKKVEAMELLTALKSKLEQYGYPSVSKYYGYPQVAPKEAKTDKDIEEAKKKKEEEEKKMKETFDQIEEIKKSVVQVQEDTKKAHCSAVLIESLSKSDLPEVVKDKIKKRFEGRVFDANEVEDSIKEEKEVLGKLSESGKIRGLGQSKLEIIADESDKMQFAMDRMIDDEAEVPEKFKGVGKFTSLKESYRAFHPEDPSISGGIDRSKHFSRLQEAITTSDFTYALGTSMTRKLTRMFKKRSFIFAPVVTEVSIDSFKQQERVKWGGYSTLPTVTEDAAYADLYEPKDEEATYTAATKGGYVSVSRKTIKNDDLGLVKTIPQRIATAALRTRERDISNLLLANGTYTPTNTTVFSTTFGNYSTAALGYDSLADAKTRIATAKERGSAQESGTATGSSSTTIVDSGKSWSTNAYQNYYVRLVSGTGAGQTRLISSNNGTTLTVSTWTANPSTDTKYEISTAQNDDEIIGWEASYIIFGEKLRGKVFSLLNSDKNPEDATNSSNEHFKTLKPIYCPFISGSTYQYYWFAAIDKADGDIIEIGYVDDQREPTLVIQDQPALGEVFTNDRLRWKVRFEYGLAIVENKGIDANFATSV